MKYVLIIIGLMFLFTGNVQSQSTYGVRLVSKDGYWTLPGASRLLGSTDDDHVGRGSINSWDISMSLQSPVFAAAPGVVKTAGCFLYENGLTPNLQGYGCSVQVDHGNGIVSQYGHCARLSIAVQPGQNVTNQSLLCRVGLTGVTSWPHVHFTILKNGSPIRIDTIFDIRQMAYCKYCQSTNDPNGPVKNSIGTTSSSSNPRLNRIFSAIDSFGYIRLIVILVILVLWIYNLLPKPFDIIFASTVSSVTAVAICGSIFWVITKPSSGVQAQDRGGTIQQGYKYTVGSEGWKCTEDGAHTKGGITQGTYNRYKGTRSLDVCNHLTEAERFDIYKKFYWDALNGDSLPGALAITAVDHYFNTGVKYPASCGTDVKCVNDWREKDYRSKGDFYKYGNGYINRVNKFRKLTE